MFSVANANGYTYTAMGKHKGQQNSHALFISKQNTKEAHTGRKHKHVIYQAD